MGQIWRAQSIFLGQNKRRHKKHSKKDRRIAEKHGFKNAKLIQRNAKLFIKFAQWNQRVCHQDKAWS